MMKPKSVLSLDEIRALTETQLSEVATLLIQKNMLELELIAHDPRTGALKVWFAKIALTAITKGDMTALDTLLDRILGRPKSSVEFSGQVSSTGVELSPEERDKRIAELERLDRLLGSD